jgi:hypothetical protein
MTAQEIEKYLEALNDELHWMGVKGEICPYGGFEQTDQSK